MTVRRVAVIGGGIAGMGCAFALFRAGIEPMVFEREPFVGGNAKTHEWSLPDGTRLTTGLSVLAWPTLYFHNYSRLVRELGVASQPTPPLRYMIRDGELLFAQRADGAGEGSFGDDIARWEKLVQWVREQNARVAARPVGDAPSLYDASPKNPLNLVPLRKLTRLFGISDGFWRSLFVPLHSSSFLTVHLDSLPAAIAPTIEDIVSVRRGADLVTWSADSRAVFQAMAKGFEGNVLVGAPGLSVERRDGEVRVTDGKGVRRSFDAVVFACSALAALDMLSSSSRLERTLLGNVSYADEDDGTFAEGVVHSDVEVLPQSERAAVLEGYANFVDVVSEGASLRYENTFVLSSWIPQARGRGLPMLVSYNRRGPIRDPLRRVRNQRCHPHLSRKNLAIAFGLRAIQGRGNVYYCGSFTTPGNGHDLSLLSGFVVAEALGAPHPFHDDPRAATDFAKLSRMML